jgi:hypothetical protein
MITFMSEPRESLTPTEKDIADNLRTGFDNIARLMTGPISDEYFGQKFPAALRAFIRVAELAGLDWLDPGSVSTNAPEWDVLKVWDEVVRQESVPGHALDQIWTARQYANPYYVPEYPLSDGKPYFRERPRTLDDPASTEWHVQYGTETSSWLTNATVLGRSASDAIRNAYYMYPEATRVRINVIKHPEEEPSF